VQVRPSRSATLGAELSGSSARTREKSAHRVQWSQSVSSESESDADPGRARTESL